MKDDNWDESGRLRFFDKHEYRVILRRVTFKNAPFDISVDVAGPELALLVTLKVPERSWGGEPIAVVFTFPFTQLSEEDFLGFVESRVRAAFIHEFEECFHLDNVRVRDPHKGGTAEVFTTVHRLRTFC